MFGVGLSSCTPPAAARPIFDLPQGTMELGIGISGEPGRERTEIRSAREIAAILLDEVLADLAPAPGAELLVFVNGIGGTPQLEALPALFRARSGAAGGRIRPGRSLVGSYVSSLEQAGAALTLLELDPELRRLWDAPVHTAALR